MGFPSKSASTTLHRSCPAGKAELCTAYNQATAGDGQKLNSTFGSQTQHCIGGVLETGARGVTSERGSGE